jgi:CRISPR-associated endonuclease/helicase Cas3
VEVPLRFTPQGAQRLKENKWHPTERSEPLSDGGCIWMAEGAEVQEMAPWIRGWGADVEVLVPDELRKAMIHETRRLARLYGWTVHQGEQETEETDYDNQRFQDIFGV